jgi:hypothetical protein
MFLLRVLMIFSAFVLPQQSVSYIRQYYVASGICALKATRAFLVSRWSLINSSAYKAIPGKAGLFLSSSRTGSLSDFVQIQASVPVWI